MPKYKVTMESCRILYYEGEVEVEAENAEQAKEIAVEMGNADEVEWSQENDEDDGGIEVQKVEVI